MARPSSHAQGGPVSSKNVLVSGGTHTQYNYYGPLDNNSEAFGRLVDSTSPKAFHNSNNHYTATGRRYTLMESAAINDIMACILSWRRHRKRILWLYGMERASNLSVVRSVAQICEQQRILMGSFFFSESDPTRNNTDSVIATIAYQLSVNVPEASKSILSAIARDPHIFSRSVEHQLRALIFEPVQQLDHIFQDESISLPYRHRLIILNCIDQCKNRRKQVDMILAIFKALQEMPLDFMFLISSCPGSHLKNVFDSAIVSEVLIQVPLQEYTPSSDVELRHLPWFSLMPYKANVRQIAFRAKVGNYFISKIGV